MDTNVKWGEEGRVRETHSKRGGEWVMGDDRQQEAAIKPIKFCQAKVRN